MKKHVWLVFTMILQTAIASAWQGDGITLKKGTVLVVRSLDWVHTGKKGVRTGDAIRFEVVDDIAVDQTVVLKQGTPVRGTVTRSKSARFLGRKGKLVFSIDEIQPEHGGSIRLTILRAVQKGKNSRQTDGFEVRPRGLTVNADPVFLLRAGNDAFLDKGSLFEVEVAEDTEIFLR